MATSSERLRQHHSARPAAAAAKAGASSSLEAATPLEWRHQLATKTASKVKSVDLGFVIDVTASMQHLLETVASKVEEIVQEVKAMLGDHATVRVAIVGYRDIGDDEPTEMMHFSTDVREVKRFLGRLDASGGGDISEDVIAGIQAAMTLKWSSNTKIMFLLAQSPCHGVRFHEKFEDCSTPQEIHEIIMESPFIPDDEKDAAKEHCVHRMFDVYPDDAKQWETTDKLFRAIQSKNIRIVGMTCGRGTRTTQMYNVFREQYTADPQATWPLDVYPMQGRDRDYFAKMVKSISRESFCKWSANRASVGIATVQTQHLLSMPIQEAEALTMPPMVTGVSDPDWNLREDWIRVSGEVLTYEVRNKQELFRTPKQHIDGGREFLVCPHPFAEGAMRYAYHAFDEKNECKLVAKVYKDVNKQGQKRWYEGEITTQACARLIAEEFSKLYPENPVSFVQAQLFRNSEAEPFPFMAIEPWLHGDYQKLTSNAGYMAKDSELAQALSHFSYDFCDGEMMLTDHQGVKDNLTDPQIHSSELRFGLGNLGEDGMDIFWSLHTCGEICKELENQPHPHQHNCGQAVLEELSSIQPTAPVARTVRQPSLRERCVLELREEAKAKLAAVKGDLGFTVTLAGATFRWEEEQLAVVAVSGLAKKAGLEVGHYVHKIGGRPVANLTTRQCVELFAQEENIPQVHMSKSKLLKVATSRSSPTGQLEDLLKAMTSGSGSGDGLSGLPTGLLEALASVSGDDLSDLHSSMFLQQLQSDAAKALRACIAGPEPDEDVLAGATWAWKAPDGLPQVLRVAPRSAAARKEIEVGSRLVKIEGRFLFGLSRREILAMLQDAHELEVVPPTDSVGGSREIRRVLFLQKLQADAEEALRLPSDRDEDVLAGATWAWRSNALPKAVHVVPGSAADHGEIRVGCALSEVDGKSLLGLSRNQVLGLLKDASQLGTQEKRPVSLDFLLKKLSTVSAGLDDLVRESRRSSSEEEPSDSTSRHMRRLSSPRARGPVHFDMSTAETPASKAAAAAAAARPAPPGGLDSTAASPQCSARSSTTTTTTTRERQRSAHRRASSKGARPTEQTCFGRCGTLVKVSNLQYMKGRMRAFCSACQKKKEASGVPRCSAPGCQEKASFSIFEYNIDNSQPFCDSCNPGGDWEYISSVPSACLQGGA